MKSTLERDVVEFRGFEKFCEGRFFAEMPQITPRTCGICPVSHLLASAKACDAILGVTIPYLAWDRMPYGAFSTSRVVWECSSKWVVNSI